MLLSLLVNSRVMDALEMNLEWTRKRQSRETLTSDNEYFIGNVCKCIGNNVNLK